MMFCALGLCSQKCESNRMNETKAFVLWRTCLSASRDEPCFCFSVRCGLNIHAVHAVQPKTGRNGMRNTLMEWTARLFLTFRQSHTKKRGCNLHQSEWRCEAGALICSDVLFRSTSAKGCSATHLKLMQQGIVYASWQRDRKLEIHSAITWWICR